MSERHVRFLHQHGSDMAKPIIGVNCDMSPDGRGDPPRPYLFLYTNYFDAVVMAGGIPLLFPFLTDEADIAEALSRVDGLLLTGGSDLDPSLFAAPLHPATKVADERRLRLDMALARGALERGVPTLGICLGMQLLNVAAGGTLIQHLEDKRADLAGHNSPQDDHETNHEITPVPGSYLASIVGDAPLSVNSTHHQAVDVVGQGFEVSATSRDGVIEAIELPDGHGVLGVQWHPERLTGHARHLSLFRALVDQARR